MSAAFTYDAKASRARRRAFHDKLQLAARRLNAGPALIYTAPIGPTFGKQISTAPARRIVTPTLLVKMKPGPRNVIMRFCRDNSITFETLTGHCRAKELAWLRRRLYLTLHRDVGLSMAEIGRRLNRDHTSILDAIRKAEAEGAAK